jgi:His/Glu/Gln/Arg/opine family amino acid ABC transporter permease subunit
LAVVAAEGAKPPAVKEPTAPLPTATLAAGIFAILLVFLGTVLVQGVYALDEDPISDACRDELTIVIADEERLARGARGVCHIVEAFTSTGQTAVLVVGAAIGLVVAALGTGSYRRLPNKRQREQAISGAILGVHAILLAALIFWFRSGDLYVFVRNFLNIEILEGSLNGFIRGAKNTMFLAFAGEIGGIVIGLILAIFALSKRVVVRGPARTYVNFFRGTPLIWQLSFFYFGIVLGLRVNLSAFEVAILVFCLNTGAYAAEVFRAGIQSIERGQTEAARSLGMTYLQSMGYVIVPQAVRRVIPPLMNEFVILIKDTSLITVLGLLATELDLYSFSRQGYASTGNATFFVATAVGYLAVTLPLIRLVNYVEKRVHSGLTLTHL